MDKSGFLNFWPNLIYKLCFITSFCPIIKDFPDGLIWSLVRVYELIIPVYRSNGKFTILPRWGFLMANPRVSKFKWHPCVQARSPGVHSESFGDRQCFFYQDWFFLTVSHEIDDYAVFLYTYAGRRYLSKIINDPKHSLRTSIDHKAANFSANKIQTLSNPFKGELKKNLQF